MKNIIPSNIPNGLENYVFKITGGFGKAHQTTPTSKIQIPEEEKIDLLEHLIFGHRI